MKLLVGNTGLIGTTLKDSLQFDYEFNSTNLHEIQTIDTSAADLYLCCLPATKWIVNKDPQSDIDNMLRILSVLSKNRYRRIVVYSTIDVYSECPLGVDESYPLQLGSPSYGANRLLFEKLILHTIQYDRALVLRLPALFGKHIRKNILYDLLNNNQIDKINYNSAYQWYNLNNLTTDTDYYLNHTGTNTQIVNLFTEAVNTSDVLDMFGVDKSKVDTKSTKIQYGYKTNTTPTGYLKSKNEILTEMIDFVNEHKIRSTKIAVCLFGEPRDVLNRIQDWKNFNSNISTDFYLAFYINDNIQTVIETLKAELPVKAYYVVDNDLDYFDSIKYKARQPIHLYGIDKKATFSRITSQAYIRQKAVSIADINDYDIIMLCRSDVSNFNIATSDILNVQQDTNLLVVNSHTHTHPGGGSGCTQCSIDSKCELIYHANDFCDLWCMGSPQIMSKWTSFYDNILTDYQSIQSTAKNALNHPDVAVAHHLETNEIILTPSVSKLSVIENDIHCYYPEKVMRVTFKDAKVLGASPDKNLWQV